MVRLTSLIGMLLLAIFLGSCAGNGTGTAPQFSPADNTADIAPQLPQAEGLPGLPVDLPGPHNVAAAGRHQFAAGDVYSSRESAWIGDMIHLANGGMRYCIAGTAVGSHRPTDLQLDGSLNGLWVGVADYESGNWVWLGEYSGSSQSISLPASGQIVSPAGNFYVAFVSPPGNNATFTASFDMPGIVPDGSWNLLVWIAGDNNLAEFGVEDIEEMEQVGSNENINILCGYDIDPAWLFNPTAGVDEVHFIRVVQDSTPYSINTEGHPANVSFPRAGYNSANPAKLVEFVEWAEENFPADNTMLVLWDHGSGWRIGGEGADRGGSSLLDGSFEQISQLARAPFNGSRFHVRGLGPLTHEKSGRSGSGVLGDDSDGEWQLTSNEAIINALGERRFDILAFDACNMAHSECLYEYAAIADWQIGSQILVPGPGYPYHLALQKWNSAFPASPDVIGACFVDSVIEHYGPLDDYVTHSVFNSVELLKLTSDLAVLSALVTANAEVEGEHVVAAIEDSFAPEAGDGTRDLKGFLQAYRGLSANSEVQAALDTVLASFELSLGAFGQYNQELTSGAGIYLPDEWYFDSATRDEYRQLAFNEATQWLEMLEATGVPGSGGGGGIQVDWQPGDKLVVDWGDPLADVDMYLFQPDGEYGSPWTGDTPHIDFSADSAESGSGSEHAVLKAAAQQGEYVLDLSYIMYNDLFELPVTASVALFDSEGNLKEDLGLYDLLFAGDSQFSIVTLTYSTPAP